MSELCPLQRWNAPSSRNSSRDPAPNVVTSERSTSGEVLIELKDVWKTFGDKAVLQGANIKIRRGEAVGIIGGSGTGKSTTLRLMAGLLMPDQVMQCQFPQPGSRCIGQVRPGHCKLGLRLREIEALPRIHEGKCCESAGSFKVKSARQLCKDLVVRGVVNLPFWGVVKPNTSFLSLLSLSSH